MVVAAALCEAPELEAAGDALCPDSEAEAHLAAGMLLRSAKCSALPCTAETAGNMPRPASTVRRPGVLFFHKGEVLKVTRKTRTLM